VTCLPWLPRRLYVAGSSPAEVRNYLPPSHRSVAQEIVLLPSAESTSLSICKTQQTLPIRTWVRIKNSLYKGNIGFVEQSDATNATLIVTPRKCPYDLPQESGEKSLFSSELATLAGLTLEPISSPAGVDIGFTCGGCEFIYGLLRLTVPIRSVTLVELPHPDDIAFHMITDFKRPFIEETVHLFSAQFWRELNSVEICRGNLHGCRGNLVDVKWHKRTASVLLHTVENTIENVTHCSIWELRRVFSTRQGVRVVAGPYHGYTGHVIAAYDSTVSLQHDGQSLNVSLCILYNFLSLISKPSSKFPTYCWNHMYQTMFDPSMLSTKELTCLFPNQRVRSCLAIWLSSVMEHTRALKHP